MYLLEAKGKTPKPQNPKTPRVIFIFGSRAGKKFYFSSDLPTFQMELFVWLWAFDRRLLCGRQHSPFFHVYIWLLPTIIAAMCLIFTYVSQVTNVRDLSQCMAYAETAEAGGSLRQLIYV